MIDGKRVWERADTSDLSPGGICSKAAGSLIGGFKCPSEYTCGSYLDFGMPFRMTDYSLVVKSTITFHRGKTLEVQVWQSSSL